MKSHALEYSSHPLIAYFLAVLYVICGSFGIAQAECIGGIGTDDIVISNKSADFYISGDVVDCVAIGSITLGPYVTIPDGATFNLTAPQVTVNENVEVLPRGVLALDSVDPVACVDSATVTCKGLLPVWPSGTLRLEILAAGEIHVYYFDYDSDINKNGSFILFDGSLKTVSVSLKPNDFSISYPCNFTQLSVQAPLYYQSLGQEGAWECPLQDGKRYYLNIKSTFSGNDSYSLTVY